LVQEFDRLVYRGYNKMVKQCKDCMKWDDIHKHANGTFGKCLKNKYWCNENYNCITSKKKKQEEKHGTNELN
jgi:hypothetical protein